MFLKIQPVAHTQNHYFFLELSTLPKRFPALKNVFVLLLDDITEENSRLNTTPMMFCKQRLHTQIIYY